MTPSDRIRDLCAQAIAAENDDEAPQSIPQLREALHDVIFRTEAPGYCDGSSVSTRPAFEFLCAAALQSQFSACWMLASTPSPSLYRSPRLYSAAALPLSAAFVTHLAALLQL